MGGLFPIVASHALVLSKTLHENDFAWRRLVHAAEADGAFIHNNLHLIASTGGYRGVFYSGETAISPGDVVFKIPLDEICICSDDKENWAFELAKKLHDRMLHVASDPNDASLSSSVDALWFSLFPKPEDLSSTLPIHWDEALLENIGSQAMQVAVDAAYFARGDNNGNEVFSYCLDLVQTRTCRICDDTRCLAPLFDCLNHNVHHNCAFDYEEEHLIVSAITKIRNSEELSIHYGDTSTKPSWRCLVSYGFLPTGNEDDEAEVLLNDRRFVIREGEVSEDLAAMYCSEDNIILDASSATVIADALQDYGRHELGCLIRLAESFDASDHKTTMSKALALELLHRNSRVVQKCATNLRQWAAAQNQKT